MSQNSEAGGDSTMAKLEAFLAKSAMGSEMKETVRKFVLLSAEHGFIMVQDFDQLIPESQTDPDFMDEIMNILDALDIKLLDEDEVARYRKKGHRSYDSHDRYEEFFNRLDYKPLLNSAEVNELARRIEESEQGALDSLFSCALTLSFQIELGFKLLRRDEPLAKWVALKKIESLEAYYKMLPKTLEECTMLKVKLDKAWQKYLEAADSEKRSLARQAYRKMELASHNGCKALLRKFCFKAEIFRAWLEEAEIKADIGDAGRIVDALSASSIQASPAPASWQVVYLNRGRDIERRRRLSPPELAYLARDVRAQLAEAEKAREELFKSHALLVSLIAESYQDRGVPLAELVEAGNDSLRETIDDYDYSKGLRFVHFAATGIRFAALSLIAKKAGIGSVALDDLEFIEIIPEVHKELKDELGRVPSIEELANEMNVAIDVVAKLLKVPGLDSLSFFNSSKTPPSADPLRAQIGKILDALEQREREVIILRFGLLDGVLRNYEEVARHFKVSREDIKVVESSAFRKMRHPTLIRQLQGMFGDDAS